MQTNTTASNLARWLQAAPEDATTLRLSTRGEHAQTLLELPGEKFKTGDPAGVANQIVEVANSWAVSVPGEHHFIVQLIDTDGHPLLASQFRIATGDDDRKSAWATGTPESVVGQLQSSLHGMTKLYQEGWRNLQAGYQDLMTLQQNRIVALESELSQTRKQVSDLADVADEDIEHMAEAERFDKLVGAVERIGQQIIAARLKGESPEEATKGAVAGVVGEAAAAVAKTITSDAAIE